MKRFIALAALCAALITPVLMLPASASAATFDCQVQPYWPCTTGYGQSVTRSVLNDSSSSILWCFPQKPDGSSGSGAYGTVQPGQWRDFWSGGYQRLVCQYYSGPYPIHTVIISQV